jgi:5-methylcytosine-specific restriction enzyme subunit McrC
LPAVHRRLDNAVRVTHAPVAVSRVTLPEWDSVTLDGVTLSDRDRRLTDSLRQGGRLVVDELLHGLRVQTRAWVGTVRLDTIEIRITPKLAGDALGVARMLAFTRGTEALRRSTGIQHLQTAQRTDLFELLAHLFVESAERVVRAGLFAGYQEHEDELTAVRGRLLVDRQVLRRFGRAERVFCRFDELEHDTDENRLLALALQLCARRVRREQLHRRLRYLSGLFSEVCTPELMDLAMARDTMTYDRQNAHYREAHELAWLILDGFGVQDVLAVKAPTRSFAFLLDMNSLFEEFVWRLVARLFPAPAYRVEPQERNWSVLWDSTANRPYRSIRPDVVVREQQGGSACLAVDAKYKRLDVVDASSADVYQGLLYAQAYGSPHQQSARTAFLVYPTSHSEPQTKRVRLRRPDRGSAAELVVVGLPVALTLERLQQPHGAAGIILRDVIRQALGGT